MRRQSSPLASQPAERGEDRHVDPGAVHDPEVGVQVDQAIVHGEPAPALVLHGHGIASGAVAEPPRQGLRHVVVLDVVHRRHRALSATTFSTGGAFSTAP
jgi:hypothetical protein